MSLSRILCSLTIVIPCLVLWALALSVPANAQITEESLPQSQVATPDNPLQVGIGIRIDQITGVDQKAENYGAVVVLRGEWVDPVFAFDADETGREVKVMSPEEFAKHAASFGAVVPNLVVENQQGNRWIHEALFGIRKDGTVIYAEKSATTLQAPHFDFLKYPFDTQTFYFEVASVLPSDFVNYYPLEEFSGLGDMLGEEEWILENARMETTTITGISGNESDQVSLVFEGRRHLTYYVIRVFMPMLVLIAVSWALFFLDEYRKRIEISGANLLVFVAFNWAISADLPKLGYLTFLDFILQWMFVVTGAIIVFNVVLRKIKVAGRQDLAHKLDNYAIKWIYPLGYAAIVGYAVFAFLIVR